jgi:hypothetical protein
LLKIKHRSPFGGKKISMKKLQELFKTVFDTEYSVADANYKFKFFVNNGIKEIDKRIDF